jgi:hypothetical protein
VLEYSSLIIGYQALLLVVAGLYGCALLTGVGHLRRQPGAVGTALPTHRR